jgi:predicted choloylglycine hydrolase
MTTNTIRHIVCKGTHFDMGVAQGTQVATLIHAGINALVDSPYFKYVKPQLVPKQLFRWCIEQYATLKIPRWVKKYAPRQALRIDGIAEGSKISKKVLYACQLIELYLARTRYVTHSCQSGGCTAFGIAKDDNIVIAKNFDEANFIKRFQVVRENYPEDAYATVDLTVAPYAGNHNGMNEHGLVILYTIVTPIRKSHGVPPTILIQEALEQCKTTCDAVELLTRMPHGRGANYMVCDRYGDLRVIEATARTYALRYPDDNGIIVSTNHYVTQKMVQHDLPKNAYYALTVPPPFAGLRVHESSSRRFIRANVLVKSLTSPTLNHNDIIRILTDHDNKHQGNNNTICRHTSLASTLASIIFYPARKQMHVALGNPCTHKTWLKLTL